MNAPKLSLTPLSLSPDPDTTVCFTGYRPEKILLSERGRGYAVVRETIIKRVEAAVCALYEQGYDTYLCGMAEGFDLWAARAVLNVKQTRYGDLRLCAYVPFRGQAAAFLPEFRQLYETVRQACDSSVCLHETYTRGCFFDRNLAMLDDSSVVVCYYDGQSGGTRHTVTNALKRDMKILNICTGELADGYNRHAEPELINEVRITL